MNLRIRESSDKDLADILFIEREAFGQPAEAELTKEMLVDPTAKPMLSLIAYVDDQPAGHILFTVGHIPNAPSVKVQSLAPLAVIPNFQRKGIGGELIKVGLDRLRKNGVDLVFVLGHPTYYPRHGFVPAFEFGFQTPYPIPEKDADAWMVQELHPGVIGSVRGNLTFCDALMKPENWRE